jgi:uncharacterized protein YjiS (DUF1127 family)
MAYTTTHTAGTPQFSTATSLLGKLVARYKAYRLYRETFDGLNALSNRELADLGLSRSELRTVATEAAYR